MKIKSLFINLLLCIIVFLIAYLVNNIHYSYYRLFNRLGLLINNNYASSLILTVWQVQALFSSLTLLVLAILQTQFEKRIYGMRFLECLDIKFKFSYCVIHCILLNSFSYIFVAKEMLSSLIVMFLIILILILYMLYNSFRLAMYPENLNDFVAKKILSVYKKLQNEK